MAVADVQLAVVDVLLALAGADLLPWLFFVHFVAVREWLAEPDL